MNSKKLHKHSLPIASLAVAAVVGTVGFAAYAHQHKLTRSNLASGLTTHVVSINHTSSVTAQISFNNPEHTANTALPDPSSAARTMSLTLALQKHYTL